MIDALLLAQKWLSNCVPTVDLDEPYPLPIIAKALADAEAKEGAR